MKLIILDRDGVLNQDRDDFVKSEDEWIPLPGSMDAVALFKQADYTVVIATNQSGIGKPGMVEDILNRFNTDARGVYLVGDSLRDLQAIDAVGGLPVLVLTGKGKKTLAAGGLPENTQVFDDLLAFAHHLIQTGDEQEA